MILSKYELFRKTSNPQKKQRPHSRSAGRQAQRFPPGRSKMGKRPGLSRHLKSNSDKRPDERNSGLPCTRPAVHDECDRWHQLWQRRPRRTHHLPPGSKRKHLRCLYERNRVYPSGLPRLPLRKWRLHLPRHLCWRRTVCGRRSHLEKRKSSIRHELPGPRTRKRIQRKLLKRSLARRRP